MWAYAVCVEVLQGTGNKCMLHEKKQWRWKSWCCQRVRAILFGSIQVHKWKYVIWVNENAKKLRFVIDNINWVSFIFVVKVYAVDFLQTFSNQPLFHATEALSFYFNVMCKVAYSQFKITYVIQTYLFLELRH